MCCARGKEIRDLLARPLAPVIWLIWESCFPFRSVVWLWLYLTWLLLLALLADATRRLSSIIYHDCSYSVFVYSKRRVLLVWPRVFVHTHIYIYFTYIWLCVCVYTISSIFMICLLYNQNSRVASTLNWIWNCYLLGFSNILYSSSNWIYINKEVI